MGEGELAKLVPEVLVRGHLKVLNHLLLHKNCRGAEPTLHGLFAFCFVSLFFGYGQAWHLG